MVAAGIDLADAGGLAAVSMRAVATALGMAAGSLYRHLSSRDDLVALMVDRCVGEVLSAEGEPALMRRYPEGPGDWRDAMVLLARRQLELYRRHPWLVDATAHPGTPGPNTLAWFDTCLRVLEPVPAPVPAKFEAIAMVTGVVSLFARAEAASGSVHFDHVDPAAYPHLAAAFAAPPVATPRQDLFERTLRGLLTGLLTTDSD